MYIFIKSSAPYKIDIDLSLPTATTTCTFSYVMLPAVIVVIGPDSLSRINHDRLNL